MESVLEDAEAGAPISGTTAILRLPRRVAGLPFPSVGGPGLLVVVLLGVTFNDGGFTPVSWGWAALSLLAVIAVLLLFRSEVAIRRSMVRPLAALGGLVLLEVLSTAWAGTAGPGALEAERTLVYLAAVALVAIAVPARALDRLLYGLVGAVVIVDATSLWARLLEPHASVTAIDRQSRLQAPFGYWNALGIFSAMGVALALGMLIGRFPRRAQMALAGGMPVMVLALYLTFSRGAIAALAIGLVTMLVCLRQRLRALTLTLIYLALPLVVVLVASQSHAVVRHAPVVTGLSARHAHHRINRWLSAATSQGRLLAVLELLAVVACVAIAGWLARAEPGLQISARWRRRYVRALAAAGASIAIAIVVAVGSPVSALTSAVGSLNQPPPRSYRDFNKHLFSTSLDGRNQFWSVAWHDFTGHPAFGSGAGTYGRYWLAHRPVPAQVTEAHSLELETAAELGVAGLVLLALVLAPPLLAGLRRGAANPVVPPALAAYTAFLVHSATDWDWEVPAVTLLGLSCGAVLLLAADGRARRPLSRSARRVGVIGTAVAALAAATALAGNSALADARAALAAGSPSRAASLAHRADTLLPWSAQPAALLGEAALDQRNPALARGELKRALAGDGADWLSWYELARASRGRARAQALAQARRLDPLDVQALATAGTLRPPG